MGSIVTLRRGLPILPARSRRPCEVGRPPFSPPPESHLRPRGPPPASLSGSAAPSRRPARRRRCCGCPGRRKRRRPHPRRRPAARSVRPGSGSSCSAVRCRRLRRRGACASCAPGGGTRRRRRTRRRPPRKTRPRAARSPRWPRCGRGAAWRSPSRENGRSSSRTPPTHTHTAEDRAERRFLVAGRPLPGPECHFRSVRKGLPPAVLFPK